MKNKKLFAILTLVCFMFTLMPVAAFAAVDAETSSFVAVDGDQTVRLDKVDGSDANENVEFTLEVLDRVSGATTGEVYIWAVNENGTVTSAMDVVGAKDGGIANTHVVDADTTDGKVDTVKVTFARAGVYTVYAGLKDNDSDSSVSDLNKFDCEFSVITVKDKAADPATAYKAKVVSGVTTPSDETDANDEFNIELSIDPNNVMSGKIGVEFYNNGKALKGETVTIETNSSAIEVNKTSDVTNSQGQIDFKVSASVEGTYEVIFTIDGVSWTLEVVVGSTDAAYIKTVEEPTSPVALYESMGGEIYFDVTDINGNVVKNYNATTYAVEAAKGMENIANGTAGYLTFTEQPADSDLEDDDLSLVWDPTENKYTLKVNNLDAEGTYAVKVVLDNGSYATATWEVKKFGTPVMMYIEVAKVAELGKRLMPEAKYVDANGVVKKAVDAEFASTGYAVEKMEQDPTTLQGVQKHAAYVYVSADEKYAGTTFSITAVSDKYDLIATNEVKVATEAVKVVFEDKTLEVDVNNSVEWFIVDEEGTQVRLDNGNGTTPASIKYIVLDKPEGAKVSVSNGKALSNGEGEMRLTSNMVGNVTVQVIVQYQLEDEKGNVEWKYYTGTQIFAVGTEGVGDVVVMSIGSNSIIVNDEVAAIDAAPVVENGRTFVPFRALAEAFGANVAYDEATQAVTAELNGVTVVMTIGSAEYTVNGEAKTMDVAPYIVDGRTMVPVRFAAEAFGIKVIPTYDENGATADILFNL